MLSDRLRLWLVVSALLGLLTSGLGVRRVRAETLDVLLQYPEVTLSITARDEQVDLRLPGCELLPVAGAPAIPMRSEPVVLPAGTRAVRVEATSLSSVRIPCAAVRPFQPPAILGPVGTEMTPPAPVARNPAIYRGTTLYPDELVVLRRNGHFGELSIAACEVHPVQYDPVTREIILHTELALHLVLEADPSPVVSHDAPRDMTRIATDLARTRMHGAAHLTPKWPPGEGRRLDPTDFQYVIVTTADQHPAWETYAEWKTAKGVPSTVVTVDWIIGSYSGRDVPEIIRNFILDAVDTWGTSYVLLAGDQDVVPSRVAWAFDCEAGFYDDENDLYADLYYSDLDGTWDANGNDVFGEVDDDVDLYPDILVGRAPTDDLLQAQAMVGKFLTYERTPPIDFGMEAFFFAEVLWSDPFTDSGIGKDMIADAHFGAAYEPIERQYETLGNESPASVLAYLDQGPHLTNHGGHASDQVMGAGTGYISWPDVDALANGPRYFVLYSIGCWSAAFDRNCIGEHFATNGNGGTIAFVGNSRYGWGSPDNPGWGYSETFDRDFYGAILSGGLTQFGAAVAWPKIVRVPFSQDENVFRWHEYQVNLLGDPEMACHTAAVAPMTLHGPEAIPLGMARFTATLTDPSGPVAGARVCLAGTDTYMAGFTDDMGQIVFSTDLPDADLLTLTATAANHPFQQMSIVAAGNDPFLTVVSHAVDDDAVPPSLGNGDGEVGVGETIELFVTVRNDGDSPCTGVSGTVSESCADVTVIEGEAGYGTIAPDGEATNATPFVFTVHPDCPVDEVVEFTVLFEDDAETRWSARVTLPVVAPGPRFAYYTASELVGDGDEVIEPGETVALTVHVVNEGSGDASPLTALLTTTDVNLTVVEGSASTASELAPGEIAALAPPFEVQVGEGCPGTTYGMLDIALTHDEGVDTDAFLLAVGTPGFSDDMESGEGGWTHAGTGDLWHLTEHRQHSGTHSWYCGTEAHEYLNDMNAVLQSPGFVVPEDARLSFWLYFDVTVYGSDGLYVEVWNDGDWETLEFIGSGGALDSTLFACDWTRHAYDLDAWAPGSTIWVRFRFATDDADTAEGFYLDDVVIETRWLVDVEQPGSPAGRPLILVPLSTNPGNGLMQWKLVLGQAGRVTAGIFDARGRLVRSLLATTLDVGDHVLRWDGVTSTGIRAPAGMYFLHARVGTHAASRKVVVLDR